MSYQERISQLTVLAASETQKKLDARRQRDHYYTEATRLSALAKRSRNQSRRLRIVSAATCSIAACLAAAMLLLVLRPSRSGVARTAARRGDAVQVATQVKTPSYVLGSVRIANGNGRCSATIISIGERYAVGVSAAHCFQGRIGGKFWINNPTGTSTEATLVAVDKKNDLSLFYVDAAGVVGRSCLHAPDDIYGEELTAVGYTGGEGPKFKTASWIGPLHMGENWGFRAESGPFEGGDSGGGVFLDGSLIAVIWGKEKRTMVTSTHPELYEFVSSHWSRLPAGSGEYG